jgi:hypothetical protein
MARTTQSRWYVEQGARYGHLVAVQQASDNANRVRWNFRCACGNSVVIKPIFVIVGDAKDCGCGYALRPASSARLSLEEAVSLARRDGIAAAVSAIIAVQRMVT